MQKQYLVEQSKYVNVMGHKHCPLPSVVSIWNGVMRQICKLYFISKIFINDRSTRIAHKADCLQECHLFISAKHPHLPPL